MNQYRVRYSVLNGGGTREEIVTGRSDWEARQSILSRYAPGQVFIVVVQLIS